MGIGRPTTYSTDPVRAELLAWRRGVLWSAVGGSGLCLVL
jgi:hypothetical protein